VLAVNFVFCSIILAGTSLPNTAVAQQLPARSVIIRNFQAQAAQALAMLLAFVWGVMQSNNDNITPYAGPWPLGKSLLGGLS